MMYFLPSFRCLAVGRGIFKKNKTTNTMKVKFYIFAVVMLMVAAFSGCKDDPIPPTIVTKPASEIMEGVATLNAEITNPGSDAVTSCGFYYNTSSDMGYPEVVNANLDGSHFSAVISNLEPGKTYYYMAFAKSNAGLAEGETLSFATQAVKPIVETRSVSEVTTSGATLNAAIPSNGGSEITACGFYYSTSASMSNKLTAEFSGTPDSLFSVAVSGLQSFTTYYYKAFATNALGTAEGEVMQFTTVIKPSVTTNAATDLHSASATLNGNVTNNGGSDNTIRGFLYGSSSENLADSVTSGTGSGAYSKEIAGLTPSTTYYFKAFASNSAGIVYGDVKQFATKAAVAPTVQTNAASAITATTATLNGNVTAAGNDPVTVRGFVWGSSSNNLSNNIESGSGSGSFSKTITGLSHSTIYYYKAYATNSVGTSYGDVKQFTTTALNGTLNGHDWVDLGLPSGLRWATCNVGANTPTELGNSYAWGITVTNSTDYTYTDNPTTLPASADAATVNWGNGWRTPTYNEFNELVTNCTITYRSDEVVFTGANGNSISIPLIIENRGVPNWINCWSSSICTDDASSAWRLYLEDRNYYSLAPGNREIRCVIRAVSAQ